MNKRIIVFNIVFYFITLLLYSAARQDSSSSLGYGFLIVIFWAVAFVALIILLAMKIIRPKTVFDKVGLVMATPILCIIGMFTMMSNESRASEWQFNYANHRYKVVEFVFRTSARKKRIEYYKSVDTINPNDPTSDDKWIKDSTWVYFSEIGDTLKTVRYRDNVEVK